MLNYIRADLLRITRRVPRIVILLAFYAISRTIVFTCAVNGQKNSIGLMAAVPGLFSLMGALFGLVELMSVFSDDFRAKTMQVAIGLGVSRPQVVLAKTIEYVVLNLVDGLVLALLFMAGSQLVGIGLNGDDLYQLLLRAPMLAINALIPALFTMIPIFYLQSTGIAGVLFLFLYIDPVAQLINFTVSGGEFLIRYRLNELPFSALLATATTALTLHLAFPLTQLLGLIAYIVLGYALIVLVFRKRELEF